MKTLTFFIIFNFFGIIFLPGFIYTEKIPEYFENIQKQLIETEKKYSKKNEELDLKKKKLKTKFPKVKLMKKKVIATAYNAVRSQCNENPNINAFGRPVKKGTIAISRDLEKIGLTEGTSVFIKNDSIEAFKIVDDRMHVRKKNQIDILMTKVKDAKEFGVQEVTIYWLKEIHNAS
ncbi:MAG: hypothetical protein BWY04_00485 [candidate division CPR1 bacterium ADurb.Bin160]|uniref:3D domain protein n=1 Tax=candidate division CPR1 bacterium ADurb.Bin160 TaxID=1852826 RepID=A0A1V5ZP30_9BACT|nr:MAG: hypothetical protein BWY04_00485 [candidate division CPR1 bacterium ADurb.Bin160]